MTKAKPTNKQILIKLSKQANVIIGKKINPSKVSKKSTKISPKAKQVLDFIWPNGNIGNANKPKHFDCNARSVVRLCELLLDIKIPLPLEGGSIDGVNIGENFMVLVPLIAGGDGRGLASGHDYALKKPHLFTKGKYLTDGYRWGGGRGNNLITTHIIKKSYFEDAMKLATPKEIDDFYSKIADDKADAIFNDNNIIVV